MTSQAMKYVACSETRRASGPPWCESTAGRPPSKTRFMTGSHQLLRLDEEVTDPLGR